MIRFIIKGISSALSFSKVEARGTLILIFVMIVSVASSRLYIDSLKNPTLQNQYEMDDLKEWIAEVESSYKLKEPVEEFDKGAFLPLKKNFLKKTPIAEVNRDKTGSKPTISREESTINIADLNSANAEQLQIVNGIGPAYSQRIVKYRDLLGGFSTSEQLKEVSGLPPETVEEILNYFTINSTPKKININSDSARILATHPYISYDLAWLIINYRKQNGDIESTEDLKKIKAIDEETLSRLKPYID